MKTLTTLVGLLGVGILLALAAGCDSAKAPPRDGSVCAGPEDCQKGYVCKDGKCIEHPNCSDVDEDGYCDVREGGDDCDDNRKDVHPGAAELCDGVDNNCDGRTDEGCPCAAGEKKPCGSNVGICKPGYMTCQDGQWGDCLGGVKPEAQENCDDDLDNDCDGSVNNGCPCDEGQERSCGSSIGECTPGVQQCVQENGQWHWGPCQGGTQPVPEVCGDGLDNDCDGAIDNGCPCTVDSQPCGINIGTCHEGVQRCSNGVWGPCVGARWPEPEICDGLDNDCNRIVDEGCNCIDGAVQDCGINVGECRKGSQTCLKGQWGNCQGGKLPQAELCDNKDNNCDGHTDEAFPDLRQPCTVGKGECQRTGIMVCSQDKLSTVCSATPGTGRPELCNGKDDDCDGDTDEDFPGVGQDCSRGKGECYSTGHMVCSASGGLICDAPVIAPQQELCDGKDNNCDSRTDEAFPLLGLACTAGVGECRATGVFVCSPDQKSTVCNAVPGPTQTEVCDGKDNNCDGHTDESDPAIGTACGACGVSGKPACKGQCHPGILVCIAGALTCVGEVTSVAEVCDGLDNDCDGSTDNGFPTLGQACSVGTGACKSVGYIICNPATGGVKCSAVAGTPTPERRNTNECIDNVDNDCDGKIDAADNCYCPPMTNTSCCTTTSCPLCSSCP